MKDIKAFILFGSAARNDADKSSDIDLCVISNEVISTEESLRIIEQYDYKLNPDRIELVRYSEDQFNQMISKGSLFIHHLKNEGIIIYGTAYLNKRYEKLKNFNSHSAELAYYKEIFDDLYYSRTNGQSLLTFDGSLLFTIARNTCILLANFYSQHKYGRRNAFEYCSNHLNKFPLSRETYKILETLKLLYERGTTPQEKPIEADIDNFTKEIRSLINFSENIFQFNDNVIELERKVNKIRNLAVFGFKERMSIEKTLFSILKSIAGEHVTGFNSKSIKQMNIRYAEDLNRLTIIKRLFQLRSFLKEISSGSAYVRDLALENVNTNRIEVFKFIETQTNSIKRDINRLSLT